jgi:hypothetical protein
MNKQGMLCGVAFVAALGNTSAFALVGGSIDANSADSPWAGVGALTVDGNVRSGVLLDNWHVLTAAHVVDGQVPGNVSFTLNVGGDLTHTFSAAAITVFPGFSGTSPGADGVWHDDLAIVTLSAPVMAAVPVYDLYGGGLGGGETLTFAGYGGGGDGIDGVTSDASASAKRVGQNRVDDLLVDDDGGPFAEVYMFDFDGPDSSSNVYGSPTPDNLTLGATIEAQFAGGDSGAPVFVDDNGVWKIAGIANFNGTSAQSSGSSVLFGAIGGGTLVAPYLPWIESTLAAPVPEPHLWLTMLAGLGLVGAARSRKKDSRAG